MDQNSQNDVWINKSRTAWPTSILMLFFEFFEQFTIYMMHIFIFKKVLIDFEMDHDTGWFFVKQTHDPEIAKRALPATKPQKNR